MNVDPSSEEIKGHEFIIRHVNEELKKSESIPKWEPGAGLLIEDCKNITQRDQFGLSLEVKIAGKSYFLKLPPGIASEKKDITEKAVKKHYSIMYKRFQDEFEKCPIFEHIIVRCAVANRSEVANFSIARPLAFCVTKMTSPNGGQIELPGLIYDYIEGDDLSKKDPWGKGEKTAKSFFAFANGLTRAVQLIHNQGVLHSFLVPRNIIKTKNEEKYTIVGFGYSSFCDSRHQAPLPEVSDTDRCYRAPECHQKENLGALWFPVDIYSIGAILYQFATGDIPNKSGNQLPKDVNRLKEHIYDKLSGRKLNLPNPPVIFTENENILKILDRCLRYNPEDRFSCAEELIEALEIAGRATGEKADAQNKLEHQVGIPSDVVQIHEILVKIATKHADYSSKQPKPVDVQIKEPRNLNHLFDSLLKGWSVKAVEDAERMQRGHYEIYGHRDVLVTSLCSLLAGARSGNIYRTMTLPSYWTDNNLGSNGRFLTMNKHMARMGVVIERIFLVSKDFHELTEREQEILEFQLEAEQNVNDKTKFKVMVKKLDNEKELADFETDGTLVAYLQSGDDPNSTAPTSESCLCLNFVSHGRFEWLNGHKMIDHSIKKIRYWIPKDGFRKKAFESSHEKFMDKWQNAISLKEYIGEKSGQTLEELLTNGRKFVAKSI